MKFYFKKQAPPFTNMDPRIAIEAEKAALIASAPKSGGPLNIQNLMAESKNYNLNLKDFGNQEVFDMQNITDMILRKVADCLIYMKVMNKSVFAMDTMASDKAKNESDFRSQEHRRLLAK